MGAGVTQERRLRNHSTYLAPGLHGKLWLLLNLVYGLALNIGQIGLALFALGRVTGWVLHWFQPGLRDGGTDVAIAWGSAVAVLAVVVAVSLTLLVVRRVLEYGGFGRQWLYDLLGAWAPGLLLVAVAGVAFSIGVPLSLAVTRRLDWRAFVVVGAVVVVLIVGVFGLRRLAVPLARVAASLAAPAVAQRPLPRRCRRRRRHRLRRRSAALDRAGDRGRPGGARRAQ